MCVSVCVCARCYDYTQQQMLISRGDRLEHDAHFYVSRLYVLCWWWANSSVCSWRVRIFVFPVDAAVQKYEIPN